MGAAEDKAQLDAALGGGASEKRALVARLLPTVEARVLHALARYKGRAAAVQAAGDLTQQVFVRLFEHDGRRLRAWEHGRGASLATFVGLVAEREVIAILRRDRQNPWTEAPTESDELARRAGGGGDHERQLGDRELLNAVLDRVLAGLDERGVLLFQRLVIDEAPVGVVAQEMGASHAALYMWRSRLAKQARAIADELAREPPLERTPPSMPLMPAWKTR